MALAAITIVGVLFAGWIWMTVDVCRHRDPRGQYYPSTRRDKVSFIGITSGLGIVLAVLGVWEWWL